MNTDLKFRLATTDEIAAHWLRTGSRRTAFETYVREIYTPRSKNGVRHQRYARSKIWEDAGKIYGRRLGETVELIADHVTMPDGTTFVARLRMAGIR